MQVAHYESIDKTALEADNFAAIIKQNYLDIVTREDADRFWRIRPTKSRGRKSKTCLTVYSKLMKTTLKTAARLTLVIFRQSPKMMHSTATTGVVATVDMVYGSPKEPLTPTEQQQEERNRRYPSMTTHNS